MSNIIFLFGTIAGLIMIGAMIAVIVAAGGEPDMSSNSLLFGYLIIIIALSMVFFGVKRYRDQELGGVIKFLPALLMGVGITLVAGVIYVLVWEVYLVATNFTYMDAYTAAMIEAERAKGAAGDLDKVMKEVEWAKAVYANPLSRMAITALEILPVGLLIALISAVILRNPKVLPAQA